MWTMLKGPLLQPSLQRGQGNPWPLTLIRELWQNSSVNQHVHETGVLAVCYHKEYRMWKPLPRKMCSKSKECGKMGSHSFSHCANVNTQASVLCSTNLKGLSCQCILCYQMSSESFSMVSHSNELVLKKGLFALRKKVGEHARFQWFIFMPMY